MKATEIARLATSLDRSISLIRTAPVTPKTVTHWKGGSSGRLPFKPLKQRQRLVVTRPRPVFEDYVRVIPGMI